MKKQNLSKPILQALALGVLAGMRSASAQAIASNLLNHHPSKRLSKSPLGFMQTDMVAKVFKLAAIGEFIADKLPFTNSRTIPFSVAGRLLSGALVGASVFKASGNKVFAGVLLGGTAAVASTYVSYYLRKAIGKYSGIIDPIIGVAEDAFVVGAGVGIART